MSTAQNENNCDVCDVCYGTSFTHNRDKMLVCINCGCVVENSNISNNLRDNRERYDIDVELPKRHHEILNAGDKRNATIFYPRTSQFRRMLKLNTFGPSGYNNSALFNRMRILINTLLTQLNLEIFSKQIYNFCCEIFYSEDKFSKCRFVDILSPVSIYLYCKLNTIAISLPELLIISKCTKKDFSLVYRRLHRKMKINQNYDMLKELDSRIHNLCEINNFSNDVLNVALEIAKKKQINCDYHCRGNAVICVFIALHRFEQIKLSTFLNSFETGFHNRSGLSEKLMKKFRVNSLQSVYDLIDRIEISEYLTNMKDEGVTA
jgi:hypothetical protein